MKKLLLLFSVLLISMGTKAALVSTSPATGSTLTEIPENVQFTFDGEVTVASALISPIRQAPTDVIDQIATRTGTMITVPVPASMKDAIMGTQGFMVQLKDANGALLAMAQYFISVPMNTLVLQKAIPENNASEQFLDVITLTYGIAGSRENPVGISVGGIDQAKEKVQLLDASNTPVAVGTITLVNDFPVLNVIVTLDKEIKTDGTYTLTIPEATVYDDQAAIADGDYVDVANSSNATFNPEVTLTYTVLTPTTYTTNPNNEELLAEFPENIVFTFSKEVTIGNAYVMSDRQHSVDVADQIATKTGTEITVPIPASLKDGIMELGGFSISLMDANAESLAMVTFEMVMPMNTLVLQKAEPADKASVESLSVITLTYGIQGTGWSNPGIGIGGIDKNKENVELKDANNAVAASGLITVSDDYLSLIVTLNKTVDVEGTYTLVIPEATVFDDMAQMKDDDYVDVEISTDATYNPGETLTYTIAAAPLTYTTNPSNEEQLAKVPESVMFTFSKEVTIGNAYIILGPGNSTDVADQITSKTGTEITVPIPASLKFGIMEVGGFTISLMDADAESLAMASFEMIMPMNTFELQKAEPADKASVESLDIITLTYGVQGTGLGNEGIQIGGIDKAKETVELKGADNTVVASGLITISDDYLNLIVTLNNAVTTAGTYTLTLPEATVYDNYADLTEDGYVDLDGSFTQDGAIYNPEVTLTYTITPSGISMIQAIPTGEVSVYSVQGILLRKGDASVVLNGLAEGIYIVNGQKVAVSK